MAERVDVGCEGPGKGTMNEMLTDLEREVIADAGELWNKLCKVVGSAAAREGDLAELVRHVHGIQQAVMANAAARAYPDQFRVLGGMVPR